MDLERILRVEDYLRTAHAAFMSGKHQSGKHFISLAIDEGEGTYISKFLSLYYSTIPAWIQDQNTAKPFMTKASEIANAQGFTWPEPEDQERK